MNTRARQKQVAQLGHNLSRVNIERVRLAKVLIHNHKMSSKEATFVVRLLIPDGVGAKRVSLVRHLVKKLETTRFIHILAQGGFEV